MEDVLAARRLRHPGHEDTVQGEETRVQLVQPEPGPALDQERGTQVRTPDRGGVFMGVCLLFMCVFMGHGWLGGCVCVCVFFMCVCVCVLFGCVWFLCACVNVCLWV